VTSSKRSKLYSFNIGKSMKPHYNLAVGKYVSSPREIKDELARASDRASALGFPTQLEYLSPTDLAERSTFGVTDEGIEETERRRHNRRAAGFPDLDANLDLDSHQ